MNQAKYSSKIDGRAFLREAFAEEQELLLHKLDLSAKTISHSGVMGEVNERHFIDVLRKYLPKRYEVAHGIVIDCNGATSDQIDIVIFDQQYTPTLLDQQSHRFVPAEAVYCVLEVKPTISRTYINYAGAKAESVRRLERTTVPIRHAGGEYPPKPLFEILAGIVAIRAEWAEGCSSTAFADALAAQQGARVLNCGLALADRAFDTHTGSLVLSTIEGSLATFLFRLLQRLQGLGTVPAVDWTRYGSALSG